MLLSTDTHFYCILIFLSLLYASLNCIMSPLTTENGLAGCMNTFTYTGTTSLVLSIPLDSTYNTSCVWPTSLPCKDIRPSYLLYILAVATLLSVVLTLYSTFL